MTITALTFRTAAANIDFRTLEQLYDLLIAAAEQREQVDVCLAEWLKRYESPPWRSLERMYQEAYPGRDVVISDVLRWADTFIAARRDQVSIIRTLEAEIATLTAELIDARHRIMELELDRKS